MKLNKRIGRVFLENKLRYFSLIVLIILSCFTFTLMTQFAENFERISYDFKEDFAQEDATFTVYDRIDNLEELETLANVLIEEGITFDYKISENQTLRIFRQNKKINLEAITKGENLKNNGEILLSPYFANSNGYKVGDKIKIDNKVFTVVGFMTLPNYIYPLKSEDMMMPLPGFGIGMINKEDMLSLAEGNYFYSVKFIDENKEINLQTFDLKDILNENKIQIVQWTNIEDNKRVNIVDMEIGVLNIVSKGVPFMILLIAIILLSSVISKIVKSESKTIGTLYALGYKRKEIFLHYLLLPFIIVFSGSVIGTILGIFPINYMISFLTTTFIMPVNYIKINLLLILLSILLPILLVFVSTYFVISRILKKTPVELIKGKKESEKHNFLERSINLEQFSFSYKFKIREQLRNIIRGIFLMLGVAVATMLLLWGFVLLSGFNDMLKGETMTEIYNFEYEYKFNTLQNHILPEGTEPISAALFMPLNDDKKEFYVTGIMPDTNKVRLKDEEGKLLNLNNVIITKPIAKQLNIGEGDIITIIRKSDYQNFSITIDKITDTYAGKFIFIPLSNYNEIFKMPQGSYNGAFSNDLIDFPESQAYVVSLDEKIAAVEQAIAPTKMMIYFLSLIAFIIGIIVIYLITSLMIEENKNTISLLKIFGYTNKEVNSLILNSSTIFVIFGYLLGIPLVFAGLSVLVQSLEDSIGLVLPPLKLSLTYALFGFGVVMISYEFSKWLCKKKVDKVSMSEVLKSEMD